MECDDNIIHILAFCHCNIIKLEEGTFGSWKQISLSLHWITYTHISLFEKATPGTFLGKKKFYRRFFLWLEIVWLLDAYLITLLNIRAINAAIFGGVFSHTKQFMFQPNKRIRYPILVRPSLSFWSDYKLVNLCLFEVVTLCYKAHVVW